MAAAAAVAVSGRMTPAALSAPAVRPARPRAARWRRVRATATWTTTFRSKAARRAVPSARRGAAACADRHRAGVPSPGEKPRHEAIYLGSMTSRPRPPCGERDAGEIRVMSFAPLLEAAPAIPLHAFAAMTAFVLGVVQFAAPKGTLPHRTLGWIWVSLMVAVAISSFWIHQIRLVGAWSPIHLLSIFTLVTLPMGVWMAHRHRGSDHRRIMILIFTGALVIAGLFTLIPGRLMHSVVFGS